jgi:hypothetical protein
MLNRLPLASLLIAIPLAFAASRAMACSEAGPKEFVVPAAEQKNLGTAANAYAQTLAEKVAQVQNPTEPKGLDNPLPPFKGGTSSLYHATKSKPGGSAHIGFSTSVMSSNGWDCLYCVDFRQVTPGRYVFDRILLHHCAK